MSPSSFTQVLEAVSLLHVNVRSLKSSFEAFKVSFEQLAIAPAVIAVTETLLNPNDSAELFNLQGYKFFSSPRLSRGGGVGLYIRTELNTSQLVEVSAGEILKIEVVAGDKTATTVTVLYRQPSMRVEYIVHKLEKVLTEVKSKKRHVIMGDFNIDKMKKHKARDDLTEMFSSFGYHLLSPLLPTRVTSKTNSCIDHIWGNIGINNSCIHCWGPADHFMIEVSISIPKLVNRYKETFSFRNMKSFENDDKWLRFAFLLLFKLKEVDGTLSDLDKSAETFSEIILSCIDRFAPS